MKFAHLRQDYQKHQLLESDLTESPFDFFHAWFDEAHKSNEAEANAMVLSTIGIDGFPNGRVVLLKELDHGFVWFTNYASEKGKELAIEPKAALTFFWPWLERQVRVRGIVEKISVQESEAYFHQRPFPSQAGAIASYQSEILPDREALDKRFEELMQKENLQSLQKPENWGGYRLIPHWFEFWQGRSSRLHDRLFYTLNESGKWNTGRLSP
jgi:pyridoxamine 5'-phosphate oxidase